MKRYCFALDLVDDPQLIAEYDHWHQTENVWPAITNSIRDAGILQLEIYRTGNRLLMIMETDETFSFERKVGMDADNEEVQQWEQLMWKYQSALPWAKKGEKWVLMDQIYSLT